MFACIRHTVAMQTGRVQASSAVAARETVVAALAAGEAEPVAAIGQYRGTRLQDISPPLTPPQAGQVIAPPRTQPNTDHNTTQSVSNSLRRCSRNWGMHRKQAVSEGKVKKGQNMRGRVTWSA